MSRRAERERVRPSRATREGRRAGAAGTPPRTHESVALELQAELGNAATTRLIARQPTAVDTPITKTGYEGASDWYDRGAEHFRARRYEQAQHAFMEAYRLYPKANGFLRNAAQCLEQLGRNAEAADLYERYLNEMPKGVYDNATPQIKEKIAWLRRQGPAPQAPSPPAAPAQPAEQPITATGLKGAQEWFDRAHAHYLAKRYEKAYEGFMEAFRLYPAANGFLYNAATSLVMAGRKAEAADLYERYLDEMPRGVSDPQEAKIRAYIAKLRSEADVAPIVETGRDGARKWFERGQLAYLAGDYDKALASFKQAYGLFPMPDFVYNQGSSLEKLGRTAAAANAYEHYLVLAPDAKDKKQTIERIKKLREQASKEKIVDPWADESAAPPVKETGLAGAQAWFDRGQIAFDLGDYKRAYEAFVRAYDNKPYPDFVFNQATSLDRLGNVDGAIQAYERYLLLAPKASDAEKVRKRIQKLREGATTTRP
jgi:tetratricopeptide (TPR) repeat protein